MNAHNFNEDVKVQKLCLTLLGEARLWFQSIEPLENTIWPQLQNLFRQRYSKLGNTHEQLFHAWRSFNFDENTETIDFYVTQIRQVATLLGCGEPQILEVFKNTLPTKLYWILLTLPSSISLYEFYTKVGSMCLKISYCNHYLMWLVLLLLCGHK